MPNPATPFLPVLILLLLAVGVAAAILVISGVLLPRLKPNNPDGEKLSAYECGVDPVGDARGRFNVKFYMVAVLFILFDIEAVFLYPWAVAFRQLGLYGLVEMVLFIVILLAGYLYLLKKRALEWE